MNTKKIKRKLSLKKATVSNLGSKQMADIQGGISPTYAITCRLTCWTNCISGCLACTFTDCPC